MPINRILIATRAMLADRKGATAIEYGLIAAGVAVVLIGAVTLLGGNLTATFDSLATQLAPSP